MASVGGLKENEVVAAGMLPRSKEDEGAAVKGLPELRELAGLFILGLARLSSLDVRELECDYVDIWSLKQNVFVKPIQSISFPQSVAF